MKRPLCLFVFLFAALCFLMQMDAVSPFFGVTSHENIGPADGSRLRIAGRLQKKEEKNDKLIYYLKDVQILLSDRSGPDQISHTTKKNTMKYEGVICYMSQSDAEPIGRWLCVEGNVMQLQQAQNDGQFDARAYYKGLGYDFRMVSCSVSAAGYKYDKFHSLLVDIKTKIEYVYRENMTSENAGILCAMLLGDKTAVNSEIKNLYRKCGIAHVLAISGLHISMLGMLFYKLMRRLGISPALCSGLGIFVSLVYINFTGFSASAFRATCMFVLCMLADILERTYDMKTAMAFSAFLMLLSDPSSIVQAGFLMSYLAVAGLAWVSPLFEPQQRTGKPLEKCKSSLLSGFSVQVLILPVSLWFYYEFPLCSFLLNLIIVPCMTLILISGIVGALPGCSVCLLVADKFLDFYEWLCLLTEKIPGAVIVTGRPAVWQMILYYGLILLWIYRSHTVVKEKKKCTPAFLFPLLCMLLFLVPVHRSDRVDMLSVGQGDCVCMRDATGKVVFVDGGSTDVDAVGKYRVIPFLKYHGITTIDIAFLSHAHADHYSAILEVLETGASEGVCIQTLCLSKLAKGNELYGEIVAAAKKAGVKIIYVGSGERIVCGRMSFDCVYPSDDKTAYPADENDASMVLFARLNGFSMLLTGDSTQKCDAKVIRSLQRFGVSKIVCLKAAHHGARTSTSAELLEAFDFDVALISCGMDNFYGHPHEELLERLSGSGCEICCTAEHGQITLLIGKGKTEVRKKVK